MSDSVDSGHLKAFIERIEQLEEEKQEIGDCIKDVYAEAIHGDLIVEGSIHNAKIADNAVSNSAGADSATSPCSVNLTVRAGARVAITAEFGGATGSGVATIAQMSLSVAGSVVKARQIIGTTDSSNGYGILFPSMMLHTFTAGAAATLAISVTVNGPTNDTYGPLTLIAIELAK